MLHGRNGMIDYILVNELREYHDGICLCRLDGEPCRSWDLIERVGERLISATTAGALACGQLVG